MTERDESREAFRDRLVAAIPGWYVPWAHLAMTTGFAATTALVSVLLLRDLHPLELLTVPLALLFANAAEWRIHRDLLHARSPIAPVLYDRHTPEHHRVYVTGDMAMRSWKEMRLVLIPAYGIVLTFVAVLPVVGAVAWVWRPNVGLLFLATSMVYMASYEVLHLSYHLPVDHPVARWRIIRRLSHFHAIHHDPRLMQKWNFNVTVPFWDRVRGTLVREVPAAAESAGGGRAAPEANDAGVARGP